MTPPTLMQRLALGAHCALIVGVVLRDPSGNALEFRAFADLGHLFAGR